MRACVLPEAGLKEEVRIPPPRAVAAIGGKAEYLLKISTKQFKVRCSYGIIKYKND